MLMKALIVTICVMATTTLADESPVLVWGATAPIKPALHTVSQEEFAEIAEPLLKDHMIVVFLEEDLSASDFHCAKDSQSCYSYLKDVSKKTYYANVDAPTEALRSVATQREFNSVGPSGELETAIECVPGKLVFINFDGKGETQRAATLKAHDAAIAAISKELSCPAVYMYMPTPPPAGASLSRKRRDTFPNTAAPSGGYIFREKNTFLLFFTKLAYQGASDTAATVLNVEKMTVVDNNSTDFSVTLNIDNGKTVTFDIYVKADYYYMTQVTYDKTTTFRSTEVNAPPTFSYYCGNLTLYASDGSGNRLIWDSVQFQAPFGSTTNETFVFGDSWNCVGFFSPAILAGLFVTIILLAIIFTGICWMMDINTMDRFDDPKGKTITINAME